MQKLIYLAEMSGGGGVNTKLGEITGYKFKQGSDIDLRGNSTFDEALAKAFEKTGLQKSDFNVTKWGKDKYGKSFPVEWKAKNGAEVSIDMGHVTDGPNIPYIGYKTGGKRNSGGGTRGHIFVDNVPVNRGR